VQCADAGDERIEAMLRGRLGAAADRRRWSFEEGGAVRRSRERRRPRAAVAGGPAGGGCGGGADLERDGGGRPWLRWRRLHPLLFISFLRGCFLKGF
jgi:hypothetical protein